MARRLLLAASVSAAQTVKVDLAVLSFVIQVAGFLALLAGGYGGFVRLQEGLKHIRERVDEHIASDKEEFSELRLASKADQAAAANINEQVREARWELRQLQSWRDRLEQRNGPGPQPPMGA